MVPIDVTLFILLVVAIFLGVCIAGFVTFARFLNMEKERGKRFRAIHSKPSERDDAPKA